MIQHIQHFSRKKHIWDTGWIMSPEITTFWARLNYFPWKNHIFEKKMLLSAEMLNMMNHFASSGPSGFPWTQNNSTYSTFQQKEAHFWNIRSNMIQHIQQKEAHFQSITFWDTKSAQNCRNRAFFQKSSPFCRDGAILSAHFENAPFPFAQIWANGKKAFFTIKLGQKWKSWHFLAQN